MGKLDGRVAAVTGAGRGIGRAVARALAANGAAVVVNDFGVTVAGEKENATPADDVAEEIKAAGGVAVANRSDISTVEGGENLVAHAIREFGRLDALVNVAGILRDRMIFNMSEEEWDAVIAVHLKGHFNCTKPASILMRQQRYGRIVNMSSTSGIIGNPGQANYGAAKSGIAGFTRVVAKDLGRYGVTCNAIAPGAATRLTASVPDAARQLRARAGITGAAANRPPAVPQLRDPEYIAPMVAYLCTDEAWNINGQIFHVAGGNVGVAHHPTAMRTLWKPAMWTLDELASAVPHQLMAGIPNPAPPPPDLEVPGRPAEAKAEGVA